MATRLPEPSCHNASKATRHLGNFEAVKRVAGKYKSPRTTKVLLSRCKMAEPTVYAILPVMSGVTKTHYLSLLSKHHQFEIWITCCESNNSIRFTGDEIKHFTDILLLYGEANIDYLSCTWDWCPISANLSIKQEDEYLWVKQTIAGCVTEISFDGFDQAYSLLTSLLDIRSLLDGKKMKLSKEEFVSQVATYVISAYFYAAEDDGRIKPPHCNGCIRSSHISYDHICAPANDALWEPTYLHEAMKILDREIHPIRILLTALLKWFTNATSLNGDDMKTIILQDAYTTYMKKDFSDSLINFQLLCTIVNDYNLQ